MTQTPSDPARFTGTPSPDDCGTLYITVHQTQDVIRLFLIDLPEGYKVGDTVEFEIEYDPNGKYAAAVNVTLAPKESVDALATQWAIGDTAVLFDEHIITITDIQNKRARFTRKGDEPLPGYEEWADLKDLTSYFEYLLNVFGNTCYNLGKVKDWLLPASASRQACLDYVRAKDTEMKGYVHLLMTLSQESNRRNAELEPLKVREDLQVEEVEPAQLPASEDDDSFDETAYENRIAELERASLASPDGIRGIDYADYLAANGIDEGPTEEELVEDEAIAVELNTYQPTEEELRIQEESDAHYDEEAISRAERTEPAYDDGATQDQFDQTYNPANDLTFYRGYFANRPSQGYRKPIDDHAESDD